MRSAAGRDRCGLIGWGRDLSSPRFFSRLESFLPLTVLTQRDMRIGGGGMKMKVRKMYINIYYTKNNFR